MQIINQITPELKIEIGTPSQNHIRLYNKDGEYIELAIGQWSEIKTEIDGMIRAIATLTIRK